MGMTRLKKCWRANKRDTKIRYYEDDPEATEVASRRRPRRHTTSGSNHAEVIQKAKQVVANGDPSGQYGTLDRKQLVSILKQRYGNDLDKYNRPDKNGIGSQKAGPSTSYQATNGQDLPVEDRYPLGQQRLVGNAQRPEQPIPTAREAETGHQYYKISQLHNVQPRSAQSGTSPSLARPQYRTTTTTTTTVVRKGSDASHSSSDGNSTPVVQTLTRSPRAGTRGQMHAVPPAMQHPHPSSSLVNGLRRSSESMNSDASVEQQWPKPTVDPHLCAHGVVHRSTDGWSTNTTIEVCFKAYFWQLEKEGSETGDRILFLQLKDEIKRASMPQSISSMDTIKALFVTTFPGKMSMPRLDERGSIYIKDREAGIFYELDDIREVVPKSHLKVHERSSSIESNDSALVKARAGSSAPLMSMDQPQLHWADDPNYPGASLRRQQVRTRYAESLQEAPIKPRLERSGSGTSLKSENLLARPQGPIPPAKEPEPRTTYRNQNWGVVEETVKTEYKKGSDVRVNGSYPRSVKLGWHAVAEPVLKEDKVSNAQPSMTLNATAQFLTSMPASMETSVQASVTAPSVMAIKPPSSSIETRTRTAGVAHVSPPSLTETKGGPLSIATKPIPIPVPRQNASSSHSPDKAPELPPRRVPPPVMPRNKAREEARRKLNSTLESSPMSPTTVEEQLADLTELLHSALISDDEDDSKEDGDKRPGKLSQDLLDNLQALTEEITKSPPPGSAYQPTAILLAQRQFTDRGSESEAGLQFNTNYLSTDLTARHYLNALTQSRKPMDGSTKMAAATDFVSIEEDDKPPEKPPLPMRQSSRNAVTLAKPAGSTLTRPQPLAVPKPKAEISLSPSSPSSVTRSIDMVGCALSMKSHVLTLRSQLDEIRNLQANSMKQFRSFIGQAKNDLNGLVDHLNNNAPDSIGEPFNFRGRRHQLQSDEDMYRHRVEETEDKLQCLEDDTELVRKEVIQRKVIVEPENLEKLGVDLQELTHCLADLRGQFSYLHDAMKVIMSGELEIIVQEEKFLKEEPSRLDNMLARCKHLSGTIFTLQKLASVQQMSRESGSELGPSSQAQQLSGPSLSGGWHSDVEGDADSEKSVETRQARVVRFKDQAF